MWQQGQPGSRQGFSRLSVAVVGVLSLLSGCEGPGVPDAVASGSRPFAGVRLRIACADPAVAAAAAPLIKAWAGRTGAEVEVAAAPMNDSVDIGLVRPRDIGALADRGELLPVPASLRENPAFRWHEILGDSRDRLARWGSQVVAVPLGGGGHVVVYRPDRLAEARFLGKFRERFGRDPGPPATWEEFADLAEAFLLVEGKPGLPPLPTDPHALADLFFRVAASHDRTAITQGKGSPKGSTSALSFQFDISTGQPRITEPAFETALAWLIRIRPCCAAGPADPAAAFADGSASLAILNLGELARLPRDNTLRFAIARLPGVQIEDGLNYVPYFAEGTLGVVRSRCTNPEAAFDLLQDLGSPERSSELTSTVRSGIGPIRNGQLDPTHWLAYGFEPQRTAELAAAVRGSLGVDVTNPTFVLRGPDQDELTTLLANRLTDAITGRMTPGEALKTVSEAWVQRDQKNGQNALRWRRKAAGLE